MLKYENIKNTSVVFFREKACSLFFYILHFFTFYDINVKKRRSSSLKTFDVFILFFHFFIEPITIYISPLTSLSIRDNASWSLSFSSRIESSNSFLNFSLFFDLI